MHTTLNVIIQLLLLCIPFSFASAQINEPHIVVFGSAETEVVPDRLRWSTSVKNAGATITTVAEDHAAHVATVLNYLLQSGISKEDMKTSRMQLMENYVYRSNSRIKEGYYALTHINFETTDFEKYLEYWKKLSSFQNLSITAVDFDITNFLEIQNKTRIAAAHNARDKAKNLAQALDAAINQPLLIEEIPDSFQIPRNRAVAMNVAEMSKGSSPIAPGMEMVRAEIKIVFGLTTRP